MRYDIVIDNKDRYIYGAKMESDRIVLYSTWDFKKISYFMDLFPKKNVIYGYNNERDITDLLKRLREEK